MASREPVRLNSVLLSATGFAVAALLLAPAAGTAATLSQVRIGTHEDHTRIVLELDEATSYRLTPPGEGRAQLQIQLDAQSLARRIASRSPLVKAVRVDPTARGATVFVDLSQSGVAVSEMILANPPRIVLDLKPAGASEAARVISPAAPAASATAEEIAEPTPAPVVAEAAPPAAPAIPEQLPSLSDPVPSDLEEARPVASDAAPAASAVAESAEVPLPAAAEAPQPETPPTAQTEPETAVAASPAPEAAAKPPAEVVVRKPAAPDTAAKAAPATSAAPSWLDRLLSPTGYAVIGAALLALLVLAVRRRRHDEDDDPLYSVMSAEDAGADEAQAQDQAAGWEQSDEPAEYGEYATTSVAPGFDDDEPVDRAGAQQLSLSRASEEGAAHESASEDIAAEASDSFSAESAVAEPLPVSDAPAQSFAPEPGDPTQIAAELGGRVQELERRLEQLTEARERLERQVAAQTEELRVQRAAIARTQRVVRSMTKGDEMATEPVPRAPQA